MLRVEAAAFGFGQTVGRDLKGRKIDEGLAGALEAFLVVASQRRKHRRALWFRSNDRYGVG